MAVTYSKPEDALRLPFDAAPLRAVRAVARAMVSKRLKYIVLIGIGGSNLGAKAIYDALLGRDDLLRPERFPKIFFADTPDPEYMSSLRHFLAPFTGRPNEILVVVISKSGNTTETLAIANAARDVLGSKKRFVTITDVGRAGATLAIPPAVVGRYSVFSAAGLFPLAAAGLDVGALRAGARAARAADATHKAEAVYAQYKKGIRIHDLFLFHPELESLGKWWRELVGESLGKRGRGILPTVSIGSTDLHSVGQLYLGGPRNRFTTFVTTRRKPRDRSVGVRELEAIYRGVIIAYRKRGLPFAEVVLDAVNERSLGTFMQTNLLEIIHLGTRMGVNAFDQPAVELYKSETRRLLNS